VQDRIFEGKQDHDLAVRESDRAVEGEALVSEGRILPQSKKPVLKYGLMLDNFIFFDPQISHALTRCLHDEHACRNNVMLPCPTLC
jgi:hypothetical protein